MGREDLKNKEYADWLRVAAGGDAQVKARLAEVDRWADAQLDKWYGAARKREPHFTEALSAAREQTPEAPQKLLGLLKDKNMPAIAKGTAAQELAAYLDSGSGVQSALAAAVADRDPQVRAAAVTSLETVEPEARLKAVLPALAATEPRLVRSEAARVLARIPETQFRGTDDLAFKRGLEEAFAAARVDNDRAGGHLLTGVLYESLGRIDDAEAAYRTAIRIEPEAIGPRSNLSILLEGRLQQAQQQAGQLAQQGNLEQAQQLVAMLGPIHDQIRELQADELGLLERDARLAPTNAPLQSRLAFLRYLQGWRKEAGSAFLAAHLLEPRSPDFAYGLAIYYRDSGRIDAARALVDRLLKLRPADPMFQAFDGELRRAMPFGPTP